jgi:hypothetical protein
MKNQIIFILVFTLFANLEVYAQITDRNLLSPDAFDKMMTDYFNYALVGSQTPTSGFKVETANPSIALKGNVYSTRYRAFITNLELEGGLNNGIMNLFTKNDLNAYVKGNIGLNFLLPFYKGATYDPSNTELRLTRNAFYNNKLNLLKQLDTFIVIKIITDNRLAETFTFEVLKNGVIVENYSPEYRIKNFSRIFRANPENQSVDSINEEEQAKDRYYEKFIRDLLLGYGAKPDKDTNTAVLFKNFLAAVKDSNDTTLKYKKLLQDYDRLNDLLLKESYSLNYNQYDFEIDLTKVAWEWKRLVWINLSLSAVYNEFKLYDASKNILLDSNSLLPAISFSGNLLWKGKEKHRFWYFKVGGAIQKTNSLLDQPKFNYKKENIISVSSGEELKSVKEGVAYQGELIEKWGWDIGFEFYAIPWTKEFVPGIYTKLLHRYSEAWISQKKLQFDIGTIWNVTSNDKDAKNLLSIVPYVSWSNLRAEYKDATRTEEKKLSELFSVNIKFAIPVNISK